MPSITETLFAVGAGDRVVGVTTNCNYPDEAKKIEKVGQMSVNLEKVIALKPDLIIMLYDAQRRDVERLKSRGLPVITVDPHSVDETIDSINYIAQMVGTTREGDRVADKLLKRLRRVANGCKGKVEKSVFIMTGYKPLVSAGDRTVVSDIIKRAGGKNAIKSRIAYPQVNFEELYKQNPEIMIIPKGIVKEEELKKDSKLSKLSAVQNGKILWMDPDILFRPGPRIVDAVEEISEFINK